MAPCRKREPNVKPIKAAMDELNPYQPPSSSSALSGSGMLMGPETRLLPRSFWFAWLAWINGSLLGLVIILVASGVDRFAMNFIGWPIMGLFLAPFVLARAKLCEKYQHRCMGSSGVRIFFACLGVCFGLGYAALGIWFALFAIMTTIALSWSVSSDPVDPRVTVISALVAVVVYLKFLDLSAKHPLKNQENDTASDVAH